MKYFKKNSGYMVFLPSSEKVPIGGSTTVLDVALSNKLELSHSCGGMGTCGTCRIHIQSDLSQLPPRSELEKEMANERGFLTEERLACQLQPIDGLVVKVPM